MDLLRKITWRNVMKIPRKLGLLGLDVAFRLRLKRVPFLPQWLDVEPNNHCNLKCPHCQVTHWSKPSARLTPESFQKIADQFPYLRRIKLQGMGEPLLNRQIIDILRAAEKRGIELFITTNGMLCDEKAARELATLGNARILFSFDGATPEVFESIRVGSSFEKILTNIRGLVAARGERAQPEVSLWTVVTKNNEHQLKDIVLLAKELGVDTVTFQSFISNWGKTDFDETADSLRVSVDRLEEAKRFADEVGVDARVYTNNFLTKENPCRWPWTSAYIAANGDVVPCCVVADADVAKMGNVFEEDFGKIWNSKKYRNLRSMISRNIIPHYCKACYDQQANNGSDSESAGVQ